MENDRISPWYLAIPAAYGVWCYVVRTVFEPVGSGGFALSLVSFFFGLAIGVGMVGETTFSWIRRAMGDGPAVDWRFVLVRALAIWTLACVLVWVLVS